MKRAVLRPRAEQDLIDAAQWYLEQGDPRDAAALFDAAQAAIATIEGMPGIGSPLLAEPLNIPGLRHWGLERFPVRWFYIEHPNRLDVLRLLGDRQDVAAIAPGTRRPK